MNIRITALSAAVLLALSAAATAQAPINASQTQGEQVVAPATDASMSDAPVPSTTDSTASAEDTSESDSTTLTDDEDAAASTDLPDRRDAAVDAPDTGDSGLALKGDPVEEGYSSQDSDGDKLLSREEVSSDAELTGNFDTIDKDDNDLIAYGEWEDRSQLMASAATSTDTSATTATDESGDTETPSPDNDDAQDADE